MSVYKKVLKFKNKYPDTISWRIKQHSKILEKHLNPDEEIYYLFVAQKNPNPFDFFCTCLVALTNKRILIGRKRVLFGYFLDSITPDLFNDLKIKGGLIWGKVYIDTIKEFITLSNISNRALPEIESAISSYMVEAKKQYVKQSNND